MATVLKVAEFRAQSDLGWEDAANIAVAEASKSLRDIRSISLQNLNASVEYGRITAYRLTAKITFSSEADSG